MNCPLRSLCVVALAGLMLSFTTQASAQPVVDVPRIEVVSPPVIEAPPKPPETPTNERTWVAAVRGVSGGEEQLAQALDEHLRQRGMTIIEHAASEPARACDTAECLEQQVRRSNVGFVLFVQVDNSVAETSAITMSLFDVFRRASLQEKAKCWQCNQALLGYKLNEVADVLISRCREARLGISVPNQTLNAPLVPLLAERPPVVNSNTPAVVVSAPAKEKGFFAKLSPSRKILAGVLGGLAGAALITSIVLTTTNGLDTPIGCEMRTDVLQDKCILKNKPLYASGYALTGALAVGIGFTLFWPQKAARPVAPEVR